MMKALSIVSVLMLAPGLVFGQAHDVSTHSGVLSAGETVTIFGSNFGTKSPAAPVLFDDFEAHEDGYIYGTGWNYRGIQPPAPWDEWWYSGDIATDLYRPVLAVTDSLMTEGRGKCLKIRHPSPRPIAYLVKQFARTGKVYLDIDTKKDTYGDAFDIGNSKTWKLSENGGTTTGIFYQGQCEGGQGDIRPSVPGALLDNLVPREVNMAEPNTFAEGRFRDWTSWQVVYRESSAMRTLDAYAKNYFNCGVAGEGTFYDKPTDSAPYWVNTLIIGGQESSNGYGTCTASPNSGIYSFYDHIYMDTSWQRIEIGNNSIYDNCTERTIQIPTDWSTGEISFTARTNDFNDGDNVWVFVVDANNVPSAGYPMVVNAVSNLPGTPGQPIRDTED